MKNNSYWEKRLANDLWNTYNNTSKYQKELIEIYKKATDEILEELYRIASKYEENGVISRSEFYKAEHLKRMEKGFNDVLKGLGEKIENKGSKIILNAGEDVVKKTGKSLGIDINYNEDLAKKLMQTDWKGSNFSKRIWRNSKKLERELNTQVKKGILTGKPTAQIAMELNKSMGSGLSSSARLIRTETMHHMNDINLAHMKDSGISKVKEIVTLDERTSSTCKVHNNKIHDIDKAPILPRHPNCRCVLVAHIDVDEFAKKETLIDGGLEGKSYNDVIEFGKKVNEEYHITDYIGDKEKLKEIFSNFREFGGTVPDSFYNLGDVWDRDMAKIVKNQLNNAFSYYPSAWSKIPENSGRQLYVRRSGRGYFSTGAFHPNRMWDYSLENYKDGYLTIVTDGTRNTTPFHEIGHMVEWYNPEVLRIEKEFLKARTVGEELTKLNDLFPNFGYRDNEVTLKDNFISPYIGKDYPEATEVLSMGLEGLFVPEDGFVKKIEAGKPLYAKISEDEDFLNLIIGLILKG